MRVGDVSSRWLGRSLVGLSVLVFAALLYLTSYRNFFYDEWDFVSAYRPSQSTSILFPHNEHWSTIPILLWKLLFILFGLRTHIPYEAAAIAGHVACVFLLFELVRRRSGDLPAFAAGLTLLVLGTGATDILWAFQVTWTLSIAFGLAAMLLIEVSPVPWSGRRKAALAALLLGALMSSGIGLGLLVAVAAQLFVDRTRRGLLVAVAVPAVAYVVWFLTYGAGLPGTPGAPCSTCPTAIGNDLVSIGPGYLANVVWLVALGLYASVAGLVGLTWEFGRIVLIVFAGLLAWHWYLEKGRVQPWELGLLVGLVAQFTLIGLTRVRFGLTSSADSHYVYVGVVYLLPIVANAIKHLPWRLAWRPVLAGSFALAILANSSLLVEQAISQKDWMTTQNGELRIVEAFAGAPDMALDQPLDENLMPQLTARRYLPAIQELGSPVPASTPASLQDLPASLVDNEMTTLFGGALTVTADSTRPLASPCRNVDLASGSTIDLRVADGRSFSLEASPAGDLSFFLGSFNPPGPELVLQAHLERATLEWVHLPNTGKPFTWRVRIQASGIGHLQICGIDELDVHSGSSTSSA